jgi:hypothetical protein
MTFQRVQRELSAEEVARLRVLRADGKRLKWLAHEFGISRQTVSRYARGIVPPTLRKIKPRRRLTNELPRWNLGGTGALRRRDIYGDVEPGESR